VSRRVSRQQPHVGRHCSEHAVLFPAMVSRTVFCYLVGSSAIHHGGHLPVRYRAVTESTSLLVYTVRFNNTVKLGPYRTLYTKQIKLVITSFTDQLKLNKNFIAIANRSRLSCTNTNNNNNTMTLKSGLEVTQCHSLKVVPFTSLGAVSYSPSIVTMAVSVAVCDIFI